MGKVHEKHLEESQSHTTVCHSRLTMCHRLLFFGGPLLPLSIFKSPKKWGYYSWTHTKLSDAKVINLPSSYPPKS